MTNQTRPQPRIKVCNNSHLNLTIMARLQGISGGMSGRTGSFTYRQSRGQTIVSQYQPIVKNPNTQGQQNQRAKFKLMSQLAAIMSAGFGTMGVTKRPGKQAPTQRNAFVQLNMPLVEVTSDNQEVVAKIPMEQLKLTSSFRPLGSLSLSSGGGTGDLDADFTNIPAEVSTIRAILVRYPSINGGSIAQVANIVDIPVANGAASHSFSGFSTVGENVTVLAYGLIPSESAKASINLDDIHTPADEDFISAIELNAMVASGQMAETETIGANTTILA